MQTLGQFQSHTGVRTKTRPYSRFFDEGRLESYRVQPCVVMEIITALLIPLGEMSECFSPNTCLHSME